MVWMKSCDVHSPIVSALLQLGTTFAGEYRIVRPLSEGGMGAVYVAVQITTDKERALKVMLPGLVNDPALRARFAQEARVSARIDSDHVVEVVRASTRRRACRGWPWSS